jgi:putative DNA primase/helicase
MQDQISEFRAAMRDAGLGMASGDVVADDRIHRYRLEGDKARTTNGAYKLTVHHDGFAVGWFKSWKDGQTIAWHSKTKRGISADDRAMYKARAIEAKRAREAAAVDAHTRAAVKATAMLSGMAKATGAEVYLNRKNIGAHGARVFGNALVVPLMRDGNVVGLQFIQPDGTKRFMTDSDVAGSYFSIAKRGDDLGTIAIVEGFATGASVREAMGWPVIVAFNAGNLKAVAVAMRGKYPDARIVICADNDQWTVVGGKSVNPGIDAANAAAVAIGGAQVVWPVVDADDTHKRTDWNDIHCSDGIDAVRDGLNAAPVVEREYVDDWEPVADDRAQDVPDEADEPMDVVRPLGHSRGQYFFFPRASGQIVELGASSLARIQNLYRLAPRQFWERHYGSDGKTSDSDICSYASAQLIDICHRKGVFQADNVRGVGAWRDVSGVVVNCGDVVVAGDRRCHPSDYKSKSVYEAGPRVIALDCEPLTNKEASEFRGICKRLSWKRPQYADLLCGWVVIAAVGSALTWRSHIVVTGPKGSGKSTVMDDIVKAALGDIAIKRDGGTTEAGMRKSLGASGRPFIMDEAESENASSRSEMEKIFFAARRSSSGSMVENANATFQLRSCFCFAAINPRIEQGADKDRITSLELVQDRTDGADDRFAELQRMIVDVIGVDFPARLMARTVGNIDALLKNVDTFTLAAAKILGSRRDGDQIGPLIAGAYSLTSNRVISKDEAEKWMQSQNWDWHRAAKDIGDAEKLMQTIMTARVRYDDGGMGRESSIGELVSRAAITNGIGFDAAVKGLSGYGIKIKDGELLIANNSPPLRRVLQDTPWAVWSRTLGDYPGANNAGNRATYFGPGWNSKVTAVPLGGVIEVAAAAVIVEEDIGFE